MSIISLTTDFGTDHEYAGLMKAVILSIAESVNIIDITHHIDHQDIVQAAYMIESSHPFFPKGTIHTIVVDPGVGSDRNIIALKKDGHIFLAPDNGVLTLLVRDDQPCPIHLIEDKAYFLTPVSRTFHGRDIFAPVSAHLAMGTPLEKMGPGISADEITRIDIPVPAFSGKHELTGHVISIDHFGNLITNISMEYMKKLLDARDGAGISILIGKHRITGLADHYQSVSPRKPLAIMGSRGYLELVVNLGDARAYFNAGKGDRVTVRVMKG